MIDRIVEMQRIADQKRLKEVSDLAKLSKKPKYGYVGDYDEFVNT